MINSLNIWDCSNQYYTVFNQSYKSYVKKSRPTTKSTQQHKPKPACNTYRQNQSHDGPKKQRCSYVALKKPCPRMRTQARKSCEHQDKQNDQSNNCDRNKYKISTKN